MRPPAPASRALGVDLALALAPALAAGGLLACSLGLATLPGPVRPGALAGLAGSPQRVLLPAAAAVLVAALVVVPQPRRDLLGAGAAGLAALLAIAVSGPAAAALAVLVLAVAQACLPARRSLPDRLRAPACGAILLAAGGFLIHSGAPGTERVGAVGLALGLAAVVGLVPFARHLDPEDPVESSEVVWSGLVGPVLAIALAGTAGARLGGGGRGAFDAVLIGLGLVNAAWGAAGTWSAGTEASAWRHSFTADWGLALAAFGLAAPAGSAAAFLLVLTILAIRLPLYLCVPGSVLGAGPGLSTGAAERRPGPRLRSIVAGIALAGVAPFAGFPARILLLKAATEAAWPLALALGVLMLAWLPGSFRLARGLETARGRVLAVVGIAIAVSVAIGLYPALFLAGAGLR